MAYINCKEAGCIALLPDPCKPTTVLFVKKTILKNNSSGRTKRVIARIIKIDDKLKNKWGLSDHEKHFENFVKAITASTPVAVTKVFTLRCSKGHINQYQINCP